MRNILTEAVNLELVNMNGNGTKKGMSSPKKETEVHHIGDPYDEYFVPVNEHRKYMRYDYTDTHRHIRFQWTTNQNLY